MIQGQPSAREAVIRQQFLEEAAEFLDFLEATVLGASDRGLTTTDLERMLRAAHSMKGGGAMMGFPTLSALAHRLEDFCKILQARPAEFDRVVEGSLLGAIDSLRRVAAGEGRGEPPTGPDIEAPFAELLSRLGKVTAEDEARLLSQAAGEDMRVLLFQTEVDACLQRLEEGSLSDRAAFLQASQELGGLGEMLELPAFTALCQHIEARLLAAGDEGTAIAEQALRAWRRSQALVLVGQWALLPDTLAAAEGSPEPDAAMAWPALWEESPLPEVDVTAPEEVLAEPSAESVSEPTTVRLPLAVLALLGEQFGELNTDRSSLRQQLRGMKELVVRLQERLHRLEEYNRQLRESYDRMVPEAPRLGEFDVLELDRYTAFHVQAQETMDTLVQLQEVTEDLTTALNETLGTERALGQTARQLQTTIHQVRMRPLGELWARFPRMLRDLSLRYGKEAILTVRGETLLVDRAVWEALEAPLLHLVRNAFDHGLEPPDRRYAAGKPTQGTIALTAQQRGQQIQITVADDGQGIDWQKVYRRAQAKGLVRGSLAEASAAERLHWLLAPGLSTADTVTELSGRGVGLDVVYTNLQQVGGTLSVHSTFGEGTTFTLTVPASLAVGRVLLLESQGLWVALPTAMVEELLVVGDRPVQDIAGQPVLDWEGYSVPVVDLAKHWRFARPLRRRETEMRPVINRPVWAIVAHEGQTVALQLERFWGEEEVTLRPPRTPIPLPPEFGVCALRGGGQVVPLLEVGGLLRNLETQRLPTVAHKPSPTASILVVDDSINVRRFLTLTLEKAGYQVAQAKDGQEALEKLQEQDGIRAIVSDIEMPRLDGFGLLAQVGNDPRYRHLPVVMLTSRSGPKHRNLAVSLGAAAYLVKPFQERELLQILAEKIGR